MTRPSRPSRPSHPTAGHSRRTVVRPSPRGHSNPVLRGLGSALSLSLSLLGTSLWCRYREPGGALSPHADGRLQCSETERFSTHTLILFCEDVARGGETTILSTTNTVRCLTRVGVRNRLG